MGVHPPETLGDDAEETQHEARSRVLESIALTFDTLKDLVADYDRIKDERDDLESKTTGLIKENETLRERIKRIDQERERFSQSLSECAAQAVAVGTRATELAKTAKAQAHPTDLPPFAERKATPLDKLEQMPRLQIKKL